MELYLIILIKNMKNNKLFLVLVILCVCATAIVCFVFYINLLDEQTYAQNVKECYQVGKKYYETELNTFSNDSVSNLINYDGNYYFSQKLKTCLFVGKKTMLVESKVREYNFVYDLYTNSLLVAYTDFISSPGADRGVLESELEAKKVFEAFVKENLAK